MEKPIAKTRFRLFLGSCYYRLKRYLEWYFSGKKFAKTHIDGNLDEVVFQHKTPLLRKLKNVDMWMQHNKINNLKLATAKLNRVVIQQGETFSFWRLVGKPARSKGYLEGMLLSNGEVKSDIGGGLCQLSNLIYWATLHTPLTVTERYRHNYDVFPDSDKNLPFGSGATCAYNYIDLQIYNSTDQSYQLVVYLNDSYLVGEWRAEEKPGHTYEVYEKDHWITHEFWGGYVRHNTIYRKVCNMENEMVDDQFITENHAIMMYRPFLQSSDSR